MLGIIARYSSLDFRFSSVARSTTLEEQDRKRRCRTRGRQESSSHRLVRKALGALGTSPVFASPCPMHHAGHPPSFRCMHSAEAAWA